MAKTRNPADVAALNELIEEARLKLASYNELVKPIFDTKIEISRHQLFYQSSISEKTKSEEEAIIKALQQKVNALEPSTQKAETLNKEIELLYAEIEKLETKLFGKSNRTSPSFLQTKV